MNTYDFFAKKKVTFVGSYISCLLNKRLFLLAKRYISREHKVLEIGPGNGSFSRLLLGAKYEYVCIEPQPLLADKLRENNVDVIEKQVPPIELDATSVGAIVAINVIEHFKTKQSL